VPFSKCTKIGLKNAIFRGMPVAPPIFRQQPVTHSGVHMLSRDRVESVLDRIRPMMQADGGDIELVEVHGNSARVRLTGMCSGCPSAHMTLYMGVEMALREEIKEFEELQVV
jgi:Fe-S cluster biogenesis protein NfuA